MTLFFPRCDRPWCSAEVVQVLGEAYCGRGHRALEVETMMSDATEPKVLPMTADWTVSLRLIFCTPKSRMAGLDYFAPEDRREADAQLAAAIVRGDVVERPDGTLRWR